MNKKTVLSSQPYKGARDFYPEDMQIRNYIFDTWKKVCKKYGFEEYDFPILEPFEIFASKSGEEIVNEQLFSFEDKAGRKLAVRPELTPGTVRMITQKYKELPRPIKWFMIGNNWRFEKPQLGRGREFYQLEVNVFGEKNVTADFEIFSIIIDIMLEFGAKIGQFEVLVSDRRLLLSFIKDVLQVDNKETQEKVRRLMDKRNKMEKDEFISSLVEMGLSNEKATKVDLFMKTSFSELSNIIPLEILEQNEGYKTVKRLFELLKAAGKLDYCRFDASIIRGFDYSDGLVYEVFDMNPKNNRSIFGGERFDKLAEIFGDYDLPATGFAMGDYTFAEFLKNWNLLPSQENLIDYFITVWPSEDKKFFEKSQEIANRLREKSKKCYLWLDNESKIEKQLKYADKRKAQYAVIMGETELLNNSITIKNMSTGSQETKSLDDFLSLIS